MSGTFFPSSIDAVPEGPGGTADDRPAFHRWGRGPLNPEPHKGERRGTRRRDSFVPGGTLFVSCPGSPAMEWLG
jgi:hypothetical protein